jgi:hypothetical protein
VAGKIYSGEDVEQMIKSKSVGRRFATVNALMEAALLDAGPFANPLVIRFHHFRDVVVCHNPFWR